ncbi:MAG: DsbA family protein [Colwellia sp.]|nr:DsbA family protein [Colwellia sp.]
MKLKRSWHELKRRVYKQPHKLTIYLRINDAYSYILLQALAKIQQHYQVDLHFVPVLALQRDMYPAPELWHSNAFNDACYLAERYQLIAPTRKNASSAYTDEQLSAHLISWQEQDEFLTKALALFHAYWHADEYAITTLFTEGLAKDSRYYLSRLSDNEKQLKQAGHYLAATIHYGGEWYWSLERLEHLEDRLHELNACTHVESKTVKPSKITNTLPQQAVGDLIEKPSKLAPIEMFWSIRSPYSYLALLKAIKLAERYQCSLVIKPVLPMVMRGMAVPKNKRFYILLDAKREALKQGADFGFIADPLGKGVERCYALFDYAKSQGKEIDFVKSFAEGVWAQGIHSETDSGLKLIVERCGLNWQSAKKHLDSDKWRVWAQKNLDELFGHHLWGVPSFKYRQTVVFGQDKIDCIELALNKEVNQKPNYPCL